MNFIVDNRVINTKYKTKKINVTIPPTANTCMKELSEITILFIEKFAI